MGGSGIAGDVLAATVGATSPVPVSAFRGYRLPGWVGPMDLVIAVSCSGRTEETLAVSDEALRRGTRLVTVGRAGSPLAERSAGGRALHLPVDDGGRMPRANFWALSIPLLLLADSLGLGTIPPNILAEVADDLDSRSANCGPHTPLFENAAKRLALELVGTLPQVWGTSDLTAVAAYRFACQLAETSKHPSLYGVLPEAHHNQVVALDGLFGAKSPTGGVGDIFRDRTEDGPEWPSLRLVLLRDADELPQVARRREATHEVARARSVGVIELPAVGEHPLARLASLVATIDFATVYLAILNGVDPTPIDPITELKEYSP
jgi:glucose/mannose-6-phosphate isomerase